MGFLKMIEFDLKSRVALDCARTYKYIGKLLIDLDSINSTSLEARVYEISMLGNSAVALKIILLFLRKLLKRNQKQTIIRFQ